MIEEDSLRDGRITDAISATVWSRSPCTSLEYIGDKEGGGGGGGVLPLLGLRGLGRAVTFRCLRFPELVELLLFVAIRIATADTSNGTQIPYDRSLRRHDGDLVVT
jgi:hypothetical protein